MSARNGLAGRRSGRFAHDQRVRPPQRCARKNLSPNPRRLCPPPRSSPSRAHRAILPAPAPVYAPRTPTPYQTQYTYACVSTPRGYISSRRGRGHEGFINNNQNGTAAHARAHTTANAKLYTSSPIFHRSYMCLLRAHTKKWRRSDEKGSKKGGNRIYVWYKVQSTHIYNNIFVCVRACVYVCG